MTGLLLAMLAAAGVHLLYTSVVLGQRHLRLPVVAGRLRSSRRQELLQRLGVADISVRALAAPIGALAAAGALAGWLMFGRAVPALVIALFAGSLPVGIDRARRAARHAAAMDAWPRLLEELRIHTLSLGRSVPQALFEVGLRAPLEMRPAFDAAQREWLLSTDFARTVRVLKAELADPTADAACETLLVAHEVGGTDLDRRLEALIEDRRQDTLGRKDARAKQAGVRFARRFVLIVPAGMAAAGMSVGTGRAAYQTAMGQVLVTVAVVLVISCWVWAGRIMALPEERRVFDA